MPFLQRVVRASTGVLVLLLLLVGPAAAQAPEDEVEAIELQPGLWNGVTWEGPKVGLRGALRGAPEVQYVFAWNASERIWRFAARDGFIEDAWLLPGMPVFLWVAGGEVVEWRQQRYVPPVVTFDVQIPERIRDMAREEMTAVMDFFAMRYGRRVSDLTIHYPWPGSCRYGSSPSQILASQLEDGQSCFAHEYGHALTDAFGEGPPLVTSFNHWMDEGIANYFENHVYDDWEPETDSYEDHVATHIPKLRDRLDPWPELQQGVTPEPNRGISEMAVVHLVDLIGEEAFLSGLARQMDVTEDGRFSRERWDNRQTLQFEASFGMSLEAFYESFARYRRSFGPPLPVIDGRVVDSDGQPVSGIEVSLYPRPPGLRGWWPALDLTDEDGSFSLTMLYGPISHPLGTQFDGGDAWVVCSSRDEGRGDIENVIFDLSLPRATVYSEAAEALPDCTDLSAGQ